MDSGQQAVSETSRPAHDNKDATFFAMTTTTARVTTAHVSKRYANGLPAPK
jgi:hypothetical protein